MWGWAFLCSGCTYNPDYEGAACSEGGGCPAGLVCRESPDGKNKCLPPLEVDGEDGGPPDGDTGADDGADDGADLSDAADASDDGGDTCQQPDRDGDGHLAMACGGDDCDDHDSSSYRGATEICDGRDNDCDGRTDGDEDLCCATAGITGALMMLLLWPLGLRRWLFGMLRRRENGGREDE